MVDISNPLPLIKKQTHDESLCIHDSTMGLIIEQSCAAFDNGKVNEWARWIDTNMRTEASIAYILFMQRRLEGEIPQI